MLSWVNRFSICCLLDNHRYQSEYNSYECLVAAGALAVYKAAAGNAINGLHSFQQQHKDWLFGHLSYDLKNETEGLTSNHADGIGFDDLLFFVPRQVIFLSGNRVEIGTCDDDHQKIFDDISQTEADEKRIVSKPEIKHRIPKQEYIQSVNALKAHILRGDCYEVNYCQEFYAEGCTIQPVFVHQALSKVSPNPFSCYYKVDDKYLLCASPERYIKKAGNKVLSQPVKGTSSRNIVDKKLDEQNRIQLTQSEKDKSENVMVVDLVRNDLSKVCKEGTVKVDELFGIYTYPQVHQMISTVSGELKENISLAEIIRSTFPMGSMTGAPKRSVLQLIEQYEKTKRGLFSGAVGYVNPEGDFDFNVVIRSIFYNASSKYLSYQTGSGITFYCDAEKEYEECLLKAKAIEQVLGV
ncbi:MAG: anthranilate synthase component I family protein [Sphingobacteriales bacterium]|nr:MAG: anthranilate synthase component I family protein [Sphingobacteriales bacterium]